MKHEYGSWYADWRDADDARKRKAFKPRCAALRDQKKMRDEVKAAKKFWASRARRSSRGTGKKHSSPASSASGSRRNSPKKSAK